MNRNGVENIANDLDVKLPKLRIIVKKGPKLEEVVRNAHRYMAQIVQEKLKKASNS